MMRNRLLITTLLTTFVASLGWAGDKNIGTTGAAFLKLGAGPRTTAMGGAFVGLADDVNAVYYNPAGLAFSNRPELIAMHTQHFEDTNYQFGAFSYPTNKGAFALSAMTLSVDDIQRRGTDEANLGSFEAQDAAYGLSYARNMGPLLSFGLTGRYIKQEIDSVNAGTWSGDIGLLKKFGAIPLSLGLAAKNFGQEVEFRTESDPLPFTVDVGVGADLYREKLKMALDLKFPRDNDIQFGVGTEYNMFLKNDVKMSGRLGYNTGTTDADGSGIALGGGFGFRHASFDFAWVPFGDLGDTFRYAIHIKF